MIINFEDVLIDPLQDPIVLYENQFLQKGETSKLHKDLLQRLNLDKQKLEEKKANKWQYFRELIKHKQY
jgi:hypothetical protein